MRPYVSTSATSSRRTRRGEARLASGSPPRRAGC